METTTTVNSGTPGFKPGPKLFSFHGNAGDLFRIYIVNMLLTIVTLGIYYPWAKAAMMRYNYGETAFEGSRFAFHGTGKEMFIGMLKAILAFGGLVAVYQALVIYGVMTQNPGIMLIGVLIFLVGFLFLIPLAIVGSLRYRASRSSWRSIHFSYNGTYSSMLKICLRDGFLTIITFGIYASWMIVNIYNEIFDNLKIGNLRFKFTGSGGELFGIRFVGTLLTYITLGIYFFRMRANEMDFMANNTRLIQTAERKGTLKSEFKGWDYFVLLIGNLFILVFTLGLGAPFVIIRNMEFFVNNVVVRGKVDFNSIEQELVDTGSGSMGEGLFDQFDMQMF